MRKTEDDLETIIDTVEEEGVIDGDTADLLQNALDFNDVLAYEVITPRVDIQGIDVNVNDKLLTLSTCSNGHDQRLVVHAKLINE